MSNFSLLKRFGRDLETTGSQAEQYLYSDPNSCLNKLRTLCGVLASRIVREKRIVVPRAPGSRNGNPTFFDNLNALQRSALVPAGIIKDFHEVRMKGNDGSHSCAEGVTVEDAEDALRAAHRIAVWFVRDYKGREESIPEFVLPEENAGPTTPGDNGTGKHLDTPLKRWIAGVAAALGLMWLWELYQDPEHRWDFALGKVARSAIIVVILALLLLPVLVLAHGMTIWSVYSYFVDSLSAKLSWNRYLIQSLVLIFLMPFLYAAKMFLSPLNHRKNQQGAVLLIAMAVGYNLMFYYATKDIAFWIGDGLSIKYYTVTDQGIVLYDRPGHDPSTGQPLLPVTPQIARTIRIQMGGSFAKVDPAKVDWFNAYTGKPVLWYYCFPNGELAFYNKPGMNPQTGDALLPVTKELYLRWHSAQDAEVGNGGKIQGPNGTNGQTQMDAFRKGLNAGAGGGAPGLLLVHEAGTDRGSIDALSRHLPGVNTTAVREETMEHQGFGPRLYAGDPKLIREAMSVTRLSSLVVAEVTARCEKRSSLDSDLLSCDMTANARKFDGRGNPAGSVLARGTGAGFNQADALEQAAQRASGDLIALARR